MELLYLVKQLITFVLFFMNFSKNTNKVIKSIMDMLLLEYPELTKEFIHSKQMGGGPDGEQGAAQAESVQTESVQTESVQVAPVVQAAQEEPAAQKEPAAQEEPAAATTTAPATTTAAAAPATARHEAFVTGSILEGNSRL